MAVAVDAPKLPVVGRLMLTRQMPPPLIDRYKAAYSDHQRWLGDSNFYKKQARIHDITIERDDETWISVDFGPSEDFNRLIEYPHSYAVWMLTAGRWT